MKKSFVMLMVLALLLSIVPLGITEVAHASGTTYYVDSVAGNDNNNGTSTSTPWKTLTKVNGTTFQPGDEILFKSGSSWNGQLYPKGSGSSSGGVITIDKYGTGNKPIINGQGLVDSVVYLYNQQYWEIRNLEITNTNGSIESQGDIKGIYIVADNGTTINHIHIDSCYIHDVNGIKNISKNAGGIRVVVTGSAATSYNNLRIVNNEVKDVGGIGIATHSSRSNRFDIGIGSGSWIGWTNVYVGNNVINRTGRNGMIIRVATDPIMEYNLLAFTSEWDYGNSMFNFNTDGAVMQYNEAYGNTARNGIGSSHDRGGFDADYNSRNTTIQYNYTHDNGFSYTIMRDYNKGVVIRYNISQNDRLRIIHYGHGTFGLADAYVYNNTHYVSSSYTPTVFNGTAINTEFWNNIYYFGGSASWGSVGTGVGFDSNMYYNISPRSEDSNALTSNPMLVNPGSGGTGIDMSDPNRLSGYRLQASSPAINSGRVIANNGGKDFWGNSLYNGAPDRGAHEYGSTAPPQNVFQPVADAFVRGGTFAGNNYGSSASLEVKQGTQSNYFRRTYVKFDLTSSNQTNVGNAKLRLYASSVGNPHTITAYEVSSDSWTEGGITWNNAPAMGSAISGIALSASGQYYEWDVTTFVNSQLGGDKVVTIALYDAGATDSKATFNSKEAAGNKPELVLGAAVNYLIDDNFNSDTAGSAPSGYTVVTTGGSVTVENVPSSSNKSLRLVDNTNAGKVEATKSFTSQTSELTFEFKLMAAQSNQQHVVKLRNGGNDNITLLIDGDGKLKAYQGSTLTELQAYAANTWYVVKIVARPSTNKFDLFVDGVKRVDNKDFRVAGSSLNNIQFHSSTSPLGTLYYDDVKVY